MADLYCFLVLMKRDANMTSSASFRNSFIVNASRILWLLSKSSDPPEDVFDCCKEIIIVFIIIIFIWVGLTNPVLR